MSKKSAFCLLLMLLLATFNSAITHVDAKGLQDEVTVAVTESDKSEIVEKTASETEKDEVYTSEVSLAEETVAEEHTSEEQSSEEQSSEECSSEDSTPEVIAEESAVNEVDTKESTEADVSVKVDLQADDEKEEVEKVPVLNVNKDYTGLSYADGIWYYCKNGKYDPTFTGLCYYNGSYWYCENGKVDFSYNSLAYYNGSWWYCKGGRVDWSYSNGLCYYNGSYWYIVNGRVDFSYNSLAYYNGSWWYCKNGKVDWSYTKGLCYYNGSYWYIVNGKVDFSYNSLAYYNGSWWYCNGGRVDWSYTNGLCYYNGSYWYIVNGRVDFSYNSLAYYNGSWWYCKGGRVDWSYTNDLCYYNGSYWYIVKGRVDFSYNSLVYYNGSWWYCKGGRVDWSTTRLFDFQEIISVAHRGYSATAPENTLSAYRLAKEKGFKYVECDVSFTADGIPVILHDMTIDRTSDGSGSITEMTFEEVRQYDFGSWKSSKYLGEKIPSLKEFLSLCAELDLYPYIEIKPGEGVTHEQIEQIVDLVNESGIKENCTYISFEHNYLFQINELNPKARLGCLVTDINAECIENAKKLKSSSNDVFINSSTFTDRDVAAVFKASIPMEVWTINTQSKADELSPYISGVTSNLLLQEENYGTGAVTWYVKDGQVKSDFTGIATISGKAYYIVNGKLMRNFSGTITYSGKEYTVTNGICR